jgi:hypothetical protein
MSRLKKVHAYLVTSGLSYYRVKGIVSIQPLYLVWCNNIFQRAFTIPRLMTKTSTFSTLYISDLNCEGLHSSSNTCVHSAQ